MQQNSTVAIVAATELTHGRVITIGDIRRERVRFPESARRLLVKDPAQVISKRVIGHIAEGEPITRTRVQTHSSPTHLTAMALPISAADAELVAIGDSVDVYARSASLGSESATLIARQVEVVKISVDRSRFAQSATTVVVLVNPATAVALAGAMNGDRLSIAVHGINHGNL